MKKNNSDIGSFFTLCHCLVSRKKRKEVLRQQIREAVEDQFCARWAYEGWRQHWLQLWGFIGQQYLIDCEITEAYVEVYSDLDNLSFGLHKRIDKLKMDDLYPPYPDDWIILEICSDVDEWHQPYLPTDEPEHVVYREVKVAKIDGDKVSVFYATMWPLWEGVRETWEEAVSPDMRASLTKDQLYAILDKLNTPL